MSDEQRAVVVELCGRGDAVSVLRAAAGTGKTYALDAAREAWQAAGIEVLGCALSARAALELADQAAIPSKTVAQLTRRLGDGARLPDGGVLVVDEAGMVGTRDLARLTQAAEQAHGKVVLIGDDRQLPEIQAGGAFHALAERLPTSELREVRRQREAWDRDALDALRSGEVERWARAYRDHGRITVADSAPATRSALVNDWSRGYGDRLMIAARRDDVRDLNERARQLLQAQGGLGPDELVLGGRGFAVGDRVVGTRNDRHAGILNGQRGTVRATYPERRSVDVELDGGGKVRLGEDYLAAGHLDHGYAITAHRAQGSTVDETFVLGSEELYREWGYTALSRHRMRARFYVARPDLRPDPELPPPVDPLVAGIGRLLERTHAKELALDALPQAEREQLQVERRELRDRFEGQPPPRRLRHIEEHNLQATASALENARHREQLLRDQREALRWWQRGARAEVDAWLAANVEEQQRHEKRLHEVVDATAVADRTDQHWLATRGPQASRLLAVNRELGAREHADRHAIRRLDDLERNPLQPRQPTREPGLDRDSLDLGM